MRENRLSFWITSLVICACVIFIYYKVQNIKEKILPYEERQTAYVYSPEEFQKSLQDAIETTSILEDAYGNTHKVAFTDDKNIASFVLTDRITSSDTDYEKIGWTPLIVVSDADNKKLKAYKEGKYLIEGENRVYQIDFQKIIADVESGSWKDKIYYPKMNSREGELFYDFLLINANSGKYPDSDDKMKEAKETVDSFLSSECLIETDTVDRLKTVMTVKDSLYIVFEKDVYEMNNSSYLYMISYPTETVVQEWYCCYKGEDAEKLKNVRLSEVMENKRIRDNNNSDAYTSDSHGNRTIFYQSDGYSYVPIPLKEE